MAEKFINEQKVIEPFVNKVLNSYKNDEISRSEAVSAIMHVMVAIANGNKNEYINFPQIWTPEK